MTFVVKRMKGIVAAGGTGRRLYPVTLGACKQLLPVYDKPMVYYPLSVLMLSGIRDVLMMVTPQDLPAFERLLGCGDALGLRIEYLVQPEPLGVAQALQMAGTLLQGACVCMVLGDNLFYGQGFSSMLHQEVRRTVDGQAGATVFAYPVRDVRPFGSVTLDAEGGVVALEEKPDMAAPGLALTGLYFLDAQAVALAQELEHSPRGELEIMDVLKAYWRQGCLHVQPLGRGFAWFDMGTSDALLEAAQFVQALETRQGFKMACLEEIAWRQGWLSVEDLQRQAERMAGSSYGAYLQLLAQQGAGAIRQGSVLL